MYQFSIAGVSFGVEQEDPGVVTGLGRFQGFRSYDGDPDITVHYHSASVDRASDGVPQGLRKLLGRIPVVPGHVRPGGTECSLFAHEPFQRKLEDCQSRAEHVVLDITEHSAVIHDFMLRRADVFRVPESSSPESGGRVVLSPFTFSSLLCDFQALLLHCACVSFDGRSAVFLATDEGGKTTAASLCRGGKVLSDDQVLFRRRNVGEWTAYGTPWTTFPPDPVSSVPGAFFLLRKGDEFSLEKLGHLQLLSFLWDEHTGSRLLVPRNRRTALLDLYRDLSASAPVYLMTFTREYMDRERLLKCLEP